MEPVKLAMRRTSSDDREPRSEDGPDLLRTGLRDVEWLRFGDEVVYFGDERQLSEMARRTSRSGSALNEHPGLVDRGRLHVVIQKGRLFQREHPDLAVLVDKGRYLLVDIEPALADRLARRKDPCFTVRSLSSLEADGTSGRNRVVFEVHGRRTDPATARAPDPNVQAIVDRIGRATFEADLAELAGLSTRLSTSPQYLAACEFAEARFQSFGYATSRQTVSVNGMDSVNVVARRKGSGPDPRGIVMVTAHLDSINHENTDAASAPGADDNGSGSAGAIEMARALTDHAGVDDLAFVLFGGEEQGLLGSRHFVRSMSAAQRSRVRAVVNMDMIGTLNTSVPTVLLEGRPLSRELLEELSDAASTYTALSVDSSLNAANSDHVSFLDKGIPAVLTIEGADGTNDEIHTARDTLDRINFDLALEILRMNTAFVAQRLAPRLS